jgi:hypothetical protein
MVFVMGRILRQGRNREACRTSKPSVKNKLAASVNLRFASYRVSRIDQRLGPLLLSFLESCFFETFEPTTTTTTPPQHRACRAIPACVATHHCCATEHRGIALPDAFCFCRGVCSKHAVIAPATTDVLTYLPSRACVHANRRDDSGSG